MANRTGGFASDESDAVDFLSVLAISKTEFRALSPTEFVARLVECGTSRLTAERMAAIEFGVAEPSRARTHSQSRR